MDRTTRHSSLLRWQCIGVLPGCWYSAFPLFLVLAAPAFALPGGGEPVAGGVSIATPNAQTMTINQTTDKAIVNWHSFGIAANESVAFIQPGANSVVLNRVLGGELSAIFGRLSANGNVFLVNPAGILFAPGARVDVQGLVASTLSISNENFLAGRYEFTNPGTAGSVVNQGVINAGSLAALIAPQVGNSGTIAARLGSIALAAGNRVSLDFRGDGLLKVSVDEAALKAGVSNQGALLAEGGNVLLTARAANAALDTVLNMDGVVRATSIGEQNGKIVLDGGSSGVVAVRGTLDASGRGAGEKGGSVAVLGRYVGLFDQARIDAAGDADGGTVLLGGNFQGLGPEANAWMSYVGKDAVITADALSQGNGGKVIVWSDESTQYFGSISARGAGPGGNGGFAEVSGKRSLIYAGQANLGAAAGRAGTLLLDPDDLYVTAAGAPAGSPGATEDAANPFASAPADAYVTVGSINATVGAVTLSAVHDIIFETSVALGANPTALAATAGNNIAMAGFGFTATNAGTNVSLTATAGGVTNLGATDLNGGVLTITATGASSASGVLSNLSLVKEGAGTLTLSGANTYAGLTRVNGGALVAASSTALGVGPAGTEVASGANLTLANVVSSELLTLNGGNALTGTGTAVLTGNLLLNGTTSTITVGGSDSLVLSGNIVSNLGFDKAGTGTLTLSGNNAHEGVTNVNAGTLVAAHASALGTTTGGTVVAAGANLTIAGVAIGAEALTLNGGNALTGALTASLAGNVTLATADSTITVAGGDTLTLSGAIGGGFGLAKAGIGMLRLSNANTYDGATTINAGTLVAANDTALGSTAGGTTVAAGANLTIANAAIGAEALTLNGGNALTTIGLTALLGDLTLATADSTIAVGAGELLMFGAIGGVGRGINKTEAGNLALSGVNTYTGATTIAAGKLVLHPTGSIAASSGVDVASTGTFEVRSNKTVASLTGTGLTTLLSPPVTLTIGDARNMSSTYGGVISGAGNLAKAGTGTLTLTGANTYQGVTSINAGTLVAAHASALGDTINTTTVAAGANLTIAGVAIGPQALILNGGNALTATGTASLAGNVTLATADSTIMVDGADTLTLSGVIGGGAGLAKAGAGTLTLSGANTYDGVTNINAGTLVAANGTALGSIVGGTSVAAGANLTIQNVAIGAEALTLNGGNALTANLFAQLDGNVTLATADSTFTIAGGASGTDSISVVGVISGGFGINKEGTGQLRLLGVNTYTGATTISAGSVSVIGTGSIAASSGVAVGNSGTFIADDITTIAALTGTGETRISGASVVLTIGDASNMSSNYSGLISGTGSLAKAGTGTLTLSGFNSYEGDTTIHAGTLVAARDRALGNALGSSTTVAAGANLTIAGVAIGAEQITLNGGNALIGTGTASLAGNVTLATAGSTITVGGADALTLSGVISGGFGINKAGTGTLTLSNANTYDGVTAINAGRLTAANATALGSTTGGTTVAAGANLTLADNVAMGAEALTLNGGNALTAAGNATLTGNVSLATADSTIAVVGSGNDFGLGGVISGGFGINKAGDGGLYLVGVNTYTGATTITAGTLGLFDTGTTMGAIEASSGVVNNANFEIQGNATIAALTGAGTVNMPGPYTLTIGDARNLSSTFSGEFCCSGGSVAKAGTGTLTLTGFNSHGGGTFINEGTLVAAHRNALGTGAATVAAGANLTIAGVALNAGPLTLNGGNALTGIGTAALTGNLLLQTADSTITVGGADSLTLSGNLLGAGFGFAKAGTGTLTLSGANTYTGATTIAAGTLVLAATGTIAASSGVANAGTLAIQGDKTIDSMTGAGGTVLGANTLTIGDASNTSATYSGALSGTGGLSKAGAGTLTLSGANTYSGATTIAAGTLTLDATGSIAASSGVANAGTLAILADKTIDSLTGAGSTVLGANTLTIGDASNTSATYSGPISGTGGIVKAGSGMLTLSGANTYTGATSITAGTLVLDATGTVAASSGVANAGSLAIQGDKTIDSLSGAGGTVLGANTLTIGDASNTSAIYSGALSGTGSLIKAGSGTLSLAGASSYSGATTVAAGTLSLANAAAMGTSTATVNSGTTLEVNATGVGNAIALADQATLSSTGSGSLSGVVTVAGGTANMTGGGDLSIGSLAGTGLLAVAKSGGSLTFANSGTVNLASVAAGPYALAFAGGNTVNNSGDAALALRNTGQLSTSGSNVFVNQLTHTQGPTALAGTLSTPSILTAGTVLLGASITSGGTQTYGPTTVLGSAALQGTQLAMPEVNGDASLSTSFSASQTVSASGNLNLTTSGAGSISATAGNALNIIAHSMAPVVGSAGSDLTYTGGSAAEFHDYAFRSSTGSISVTVAGILGRSTPDALDAASVRLSAGQIGYGPERTAAVQLSERATEVRYATPANLNALVSFEGRDELKAGVGVNPGYGPEAFYYNGVLTGASNLGGSVDVGSGVVLTGAAVLRTAVGSLVKFNDDLLERQIRSNNTPGQADEMISYGLAGNLAAPSSAVIGNIRRLAPPADCAADDTMCQGLAGAKVGDPRR